ncbi:type II toxin-antitoxin system HicB family antitoxin [Chlorogloeopsis sp. ULAP01]|uniref:type II toxin-antitoxin system HicB family antitoxin n=1 Tax=Chlorogloeopsis sp. ULAP01 TaxID=3056483 RepID=UPI0025AAEC3D|nr:type II toxin-antitoxin system HicB family antitoxin [Chlorogloeopsis sp. ULAP01]MDM9379359.1 type II toxin-antitoxin system HicB family antitoxin [Chlorogloeopsis sp. ULAP01]
MMKNKQTQAERKSLDYYLNLNYPITLYPDTEEGGYVAEIKDLSGCLTQGETLEEIIDNIAEARELWIETVYENGDEIPLPSTEINDSFDLQMRIPKALHHSLSVLAQREGMSLDKYILSVLAEVNDKILAR